MRGKNWILLTFAILIIIIVITLVFRHPKPAPAAKESSVLVHLETVRLQSVTPTLVSYGTVSFAPEKVQQLSVPDEAWVAKIYVTPGQIVKKSDLLIQLTPTANVNLALENAKIAVQFANKDLIRTEDLRMKFLATNAEVQVAKENLAKAQINLKILTAQQTETSTALKSPCECTIIAVNVQPGQVTNPNASLMTLTIKSNFQIRLGVESEDLKLIRLGQKVIIKPLYGSNQTIEGDITQITTQVNINTGMIDVIIPVTNAVGLLPGSMVKGEIQLQPKMNALVVPRTAVLFDNNKPYLFVANNGKAQRRWVTIGTDDGKFVTILSGLKPNEKVITLGNYELQNGMRIRVEQQ